MLSTLLGVLQPAAATLVANIENPITASAGRMRMMMLSLWLVRICLCNDKGNQVTRRRPKQGYNLRSLRNCPPIVVTATTPAINSIKSNVIRLGLIPAAYRRIKSSMSGIACVLHNQQSNKWARLLIDVTAAKMPPLDLTGQLLGAGPPNRGDADQVRKLEVCRRAAL